MLSSGGISIFIMSMHINEGSIKNEETKGGLEEPGILFLLEKLVIQAAHKTVIYESGPRQGLI